MLECGLRRDIRCKAVALPAYDEHYRLFSSADLESFLHLLQEI
jgi:hypothetical protein